MCRSAVSLTWICGRKLIVFYLLLHSYYVINDTFLYFIIYSAFICLTCDHLILSCKFFTFLLKLYFLIFEFFFVFIMFCFIFSCIKNK